MGHRQRVADGGLGARVIQTDREIAHHLSVVFECQLHPPAGGGTIGRGLVVDEPSCRFLSVRQLPVLVAGDVGVIAVGQERHQVALAHHPDRESIGPQRQHARDDSVAAKRTPVRR
jgi:hypothetical protein